MDRPCPRCSAPLTLLALADSGAEICDACGGMFLTPVSLSRLVADHDQCVRARDELPRDDYHLDLNVRYLPCPECGTRMNHKRYGRTSHVVVDMCREHGVWFDRGALVKVLDFVAKGGLERQKRLEEADAHERERDARVDKLREQLMRGLSQNGSLATQRWGRREDQTQLLIDALDILVTMVG